MKKRAYEDTDMPIGKLIPAPDFLPPPDQLVFPKEVTVKVTLALSVNSINFFKAHAKKNRTKYQTMIRVLLDKYVTGKRKLK